ncbi:triple tyrosine motif-containing protein [Clostridium niameyense]|uniref:triple tyrosine motif-containing protein n=1 Tax=Clostridium niameyense TaxID=1622073 RepID=UPI00067EA1E7|nr:triple tyrosine motif-containing protein [Clostridium niameyense]
MEELNIVFDKESPQEKDSVINIIANMECDRKIVYKFIIGKDSIWNTVRQFTDSNIYKWHPKEDGKYIIMVQAKYKGESKPFNAIAKCDYIIGENDEKLIKNVYLNKDDLNLGEKLEVVVESTKFPLMFRYWIREDSNWSMLKDYCTENIVSFTVKKSGIQELLVECKSLNSTSEYDDFATAVYKVNSIDNIEIVDFKCLTNDIICNEELIFNVEAVYSEERNILYKFIKINPQGECECIQNYSSKNMVCYKENKSGEYKLLCLVKDIYSQNEFDDRAVLKFVVKPYKDVVIRKFTANLNSPQMCETPIELKINAEGGQELLYRFKIEGKHSENSGYTRSSTYLWNPMLKGKYKIEASVKDVSSEEEYEDISYIDYNIEENFNKEPITIEKVILDKGNNVVKGQEVIIRVMSDGMDNARYSFIVRKNGIEKERIEYGSCNWTKFFPDEIGVYEIEVLAKHRYSSREYDSHFITYINSYSYIPANIDYVLYPIKESYIVGDEILIKVITENSKENLVKYILNINNQRVEETDFISDKSFMYVTKCSGVYNIEILAKNKNSDRDFDSKKEININVREAMPITNTKIKINDTDIKINETVTFTVESEGGQGVLYQFYLMNKDEWQLVQDYSRKNYYTFMPFNKGKYEILALSKSTYCKCAYEDYDILRFKV